jgi:5'-deoxynucleotidase YfbR-like HD superfamily hydrolase
MGVQNEYDGHWITTYTGEKFHYLNPSRFEIHIEDIAHALSLTCRFGGHCKMFYSVAEHSVRVSGLVQNKYKLKALLHDAHEAYLHDVPRPIKHDMTQYKKFADVIQLAISNKFYCPIDGDKEIKHADDVLLSTEKEFMIKNIEDWAELPEPLKSFRPMNWKNAERQFLKKFKEYLRSSNGP